MSEERARRLVRKARETNRQRSASERKHGFGSPEDGPPITTLRTIMAALWCGMSTDDWDAIAEGYAMCGDLHRMVSGKAYEPESVEAP